MEERDIARAEKVGVKGVSETLGASPSQLAEIEAREQEAAAEAAEEQAVWEKVEEFWVAADATGVGPARLRFTMNNGRQIEGFVEKIVADAGAAEWALVVRTSSQFREALPVREIELIEEEGER